METLLPFAGELVTVASRPQVGGCDGLMGRLAISGGWVGSHLGGDHHKQKKRQAETMLGHCYLLRLSPAVTWSASAKGRFCAKDREDIPAAKRGAAPTTTRSPSRQLAPAAGRRPSGAAAQAAVAPWMSLWSSSPPHPWSSAPPCPYISKSRSPPAGSRELHAVVPLEL
jgi:hypothetical protein